MEGFFDEKSSKWIQWYKNITIVLFWIYMLAAFITGCAAWADNLWITDDPFLDGLICLAGGCVVAFVQLVVNMLIIQLLNNVQSIREKLEEAK